MDYVFFFFLFSIKTSNFFFRHFEQFFHFLSERSLVDFLDWYPILWNQWQVQLEGTLFIIFQIFIHFIHHSFVSNSLMFLRLLCQMEIDSNSKGKFFKSWHPKFSYLLLFLFFFFKREWSNNAYLAGTGYGDSAGNKGCIFTA